MQTFLPYPDYSGSAKCLDNKRLGKQRVECKQILLALNIPVGEHTPKESRWVNHPAVKMWRGYELSLCRYAQFVCEEWRRRGFKDILAPQFIAAAVPLFIRQKYEYLDDPRLNPPWLNNELFHASHRSNLLRKDAKFYGQFGWTEPDTLPYIWPV